MSPKKPAEPIDGQIDMLGGPDYMTPPARDDDRERCSVSSMLNAYKLGLNESDYYFVRPEMVTAVAPNNMRKSLIDVPRSIQESPFVVSYTDNRTHTERYIAVTAQEAGILPRSVPALGNNARIRSQAKASGPIVSNQAQAKAERASIHAQETKLPGVTTYLTELENQANLISKFEVASRGRNIGLSQFGPERRFRENFVYLQTFVIDEMARAYGEQNKLTASQMKMVADTLTYAIALGPNKNRNFHAFMEFALEYNGHKQELARQRKESMERNIGRHIAKIAQQQ